jgi:hypothetical protein
MKYLIILFLTLCLNYSSIAGNDRYADLQIERKNIKKLGTVLSPLNFIQIPFSFSSDSVTFSKRYQKILSTSPVVKIELYYTGFKEAKGFSNDTLNYKRLDDLKKKFPELFKDSRIKWVFIKQTGATSVDVARTYFHGFIIYYKTSSGYKDGIMLMNLLEGKDPLSGLDSTLFEYILGDIEIKNVAESPLFDTTVISVLNRNPNWKNMLIVCDYTGSMGPYFTQVIKWQFLNKKKNTNRVANYVLFNDGDDNKVPYGQWNSRVKEIGNTGGIYLLKDPSMDDLVDKSLEVVRAGCGGDFPENDFEAILKGVNEFGRDMDVVWIADNFAFPRDSSLASNLKDIRIKIVLCGAESGISPLYLELAHKYHWPIYTIEKDIENLEQLETEKGFLYKGRKFRLINGVVQRVK